MTRTEPPRAGTGSRRLAIGLLVAEALLVILPTLAVAEVWLGARELGAAVRLRSPDLFGQGLAQLAGPALVVLLLSAAVGVHRGRLAWTVTALALQPLVAAPAVLPALRPFPTLARVPGGDIALLGLVAVTTVVLVRLLVGAGAPPAPQQPHHRAGRLLLATLAGSIIAGIALGLAQPGLPSSPWSMLLESGGVAAAPAGQPFPTSGSGNVVPQNPGMAADPWGSLHNDSWATDAYAVPGPADPGGADVVSLLTGGDCATITFDSHGRLVTLCATLRSVEAWVLDPRTLRVLARATVGSRPLALTDFSGGGYFFLDERDRIVLPARGGVIRIIAVAGGPDAASLVPAREVPVGTRLQPDEQLTAVMPDWRGGYWFAGDAGTVGIADPDGGGVSAIRLGGERITNSFAMTRDAAYVVTDAALYRLEASAIGEPQVAWREPYDRGTRRKPGQTSQGSGTTPTILEGGRLVAITDNAEPRMQVVVMRTDRDTAERVHCRVPVFAEGRSATDNSLVAVGRSLVVENNFGYAPAVTATVGGATTEPGLARIDVGDEGCTQAWWTTDVSVPSAVSKASTADGLLYTYGKPASWWGADGWYFAAVELATGRVAWTRLAGTGLAFNNHYAGVAITPAGDLVAGTVSGLVLLRGGGR